MKKLLILLFLQIGALFSQEISYILPDIGAPGMGVYVEVIGPSDKKGNFGTDGYFDNDPFSSIRLEAINVLDKKRLTFGPIVVSWDGRMVSSQAFINPNENPNSSNWNLLNPQFRIPIGVYINGNLSNIDTFFIVQPFQMGNVAGKPERILGEGTLGIRSKRGAMIVDSLILGNGTYTVSIKDCDLIADGNQAYLPFVLLAKGNIIGGTASIISVDGGMNGNSAHGGPGGGGGGGKYCDLNASSGGGDGFTGGGPGGTNLFNNSLSYRRNIGNGTGKQPTTLDDKGSKIVGGMSLNGVLGGRSTSGIYESAGGGTGHPFGKSAKDCDPNTDCNTNPGEFGAGGGSGQNQVGGSGGYGSDGFGYDVNAKNGGKAHGNPMGIPLAGGSGGASGNPQYTFGGCSGEGGGAGGAIRLSANLVRSITFNANGKDGGGGGGDKGGGGSGGFIDLNSKLADNNNILNVKPGLRAGYGRLRYNNPNMTGVFNPVAATPYFGPTSDTSNFIERISQVTGTFSNNTQPHVLLKWESTYWVDVTKKLKINGNKWSLDFDIKTKDTLIYLSSYQSESGIWDNDYLYIPQHIFSQASCNVLQKIKSPIIAGDSIVKESITACPNEMIFKTITLYNKGDGMLFMDIFKSYGKDTNIFKYFGIYNMIDRISPDDSITVTLWFKSPKSITFSDTLFIPHNDKFANHQPWAIGINISIDIPSVETRDTLNTKKYDITLPKSLYVGDICWGDKIKSAFRVYNTGKQVVNLRLESSAHQGYDMTINGSDVIPPAGFATIEVEFKSYNVLFSDTVFIKKYYVYISQCTNPIDSIMIYATMSRIMYKSEGVVNSGQAYGDFGKIAVNSTKNIKLWFENRSKKPLTNIITQPLTGTAFKLITNLPAMIFVTAQTDSIEFSYTPKDTLDYKDSLKIQISDGLCSQEFTFYLSGGALPIKRMSIRIDSVISSPLNRDLSIPVYAILSDNRDTLKNMKMFAGINFRKTLFTPYADGDISILKDSIYLNRRFIGFSVENYEINKTDSLIFNLKGAALLGDTIKTDIKWDYLYFADPSLVVSDKELNGSLEIIICEEGGARLIKDTSPQKMISSYKNSELLVDINVLAVGDYKLDLYDLQGGCINLNKWSHSLSNDKNYNFRFTLSSISNGIYYLKMTSPSGIVTLPLVIID